MLLMGDYDTMETTLRSLRCMITEMLLLEKAPSREDWQNHIVGFLSGAIREFYKARLGDKNKLSAQQDIDHWCKEVSNLLDGALNVYVHKTKTKFDKQKAYVQAIEEIKSIDAKKRREAERIIERDYQTTVILHISDKDTEDFWKFADATFRD
jgi:hypothetical protein